jgi:hypothetical protein
MKTIRSGWPVYLLVAGLFAGCASSAHIEKDDHADFSSYRTYAWDEDSKGGRRQDLTEQQIKDAVGRELKEHAGWRVVKNRPDVILSYDVLVERSVKESSNPRYSVPFTRMVYNPYTRRYATIWYPSEFMGYERARYPVQEGTVTITMIDTKTDKMVWQGWTTGEVDSRHMTSREVNTAVRSIFRKFDIAKK